MFQIQTDRNVAFLSSWLPSFALYVPTEKEVEAGLVIHVYRSSAQSASLFSQVVLSEIALKYHLVSDVEMNQAVEDKDYFLLAIISTSSCGDM